MMMPFHVIEPTRPALPIILSCPHVGTEIPSDIRMQLDPALARATPDTDWFVHQLYGFAPDLGITMIHAEFSRYVVDLNRPVDSAKLYQDGRSETGVVPFKSFSGVPLYPEGEPAPREISRRVDLYWRPYHEWLQKRLEQLRAQHGHVLFFDAHSIRRRVATIRPEAFPDMILGDQRGQTAHPMLSQTAFEVLEREGFDVARNDPFMGGYLTRSCGQPQRGIHALQLEMSQDVYMDEERVCRDPQKEARVAATLATMFEQLAVVVRSLA